MWFRKKEIISFKTISLHLSGMRHTCEYEIVCNGNTSEITKYYFDYTNGKETRNPVHTVKCETNEVLAIVNQCKLIYWDGFYGKHPRRIKDGTMFTLKAIVNEDKKIYAHGSQNFPRHYHDFRGYIEGKFDD